MKYILLLLSACGIIGLAACKKNNTVSTATPATISTIQFTENGVSVSWSDTVNRTPRDDSAGMAIFGFEDSTLNQPTTFLYYLYDGQPGYPFNIQFAAGLKDTALLEETYTYQFSAADTVGYYLTGLHPSSYQQGIAFSVVEPLGNVLLSDTFTISSVSNGLANGTFSATLCTSLADTTAQVHITNGVFSNVPVFPSPR